MGQSNRERETERQRDRQTEKKKREIEKREKKKREKKKRKRKKKKKKKKKREREDEVELGEEVLVAFEILRFRVFGSDGRLVGRERSVERAIGPAVTDSILPLLHQWAVALCACEVMRMPRHPDGRQHFPHDHSPTPPTLGGERVDVVCERERERERRRRRRRGRM